MLPHSTPTAGVDRWLQHDGSRLRWRDQGRGEPLMLLHGWALDLDIWDPLAALLGRFARVLRFDRRGYGASSGRPSLAADATDALAVLRAANLDRCTIVGQSQGARVAVALARAHPERFTRVVLDGAPALEGLADDDHEPELPLERYRERLRSGGRSALVALIAKHPLLQLHAGASDAPAILACTLARYPAHDLLLHGSTATSPVPSRGAFAQPALILNGALDSRVRLRIGTRLAQALPRATRVVLAGCGHLACLDDPQAYADALRAAVPS